VALPIYIKNGIVKAKEELWKLSKYFTIQKYNSSKKETKKAFKIIITLLKLISSFNTSQINIFQNPHNKNRPS
jgi:hypothetical protein